MTYLIHARLCVYFEVGENEEDSDAESSYSDAEEDAPPRKRLRETPGRKSSTHTEPHRYMHTDTQTSAHPTHKHNTLSNGLSYDCMCIKL